MHAGLDGLLVWAFESKASRIAFPERPAPFWVRIHGQNHQVTERAVDDYEFSQIVNHVYGADGMARLQMGKDFDTGVFDFIEPLEAASASALTPRPRARRAATAAQRCHAADRRYAGRR